MLVRYFLKKKINLIGWFRILERAQPSVSEVTRPSFNLVWRLKDVACETR